MKQTALARWMVSIREVPVAYGRTLRMGWHCLKNSWPALRQRQWQEALKWGLSGGAKVLLHGPLGCAVYLLARTVSGLWDLGGNGERGRGLSDAEKAILKVVFRDTLAIEDLQLLTSGLGVLNWMPNPFVLGSTIYLPNWRHGFEDQRWRSLLVHEAVHVWQFQRQGLAYISESLLGQWFGYPYNFAAAVDREIPWIRWNPEQQAMLVEMAWRCGWFQGGETEALHVRWTDPKSNFGFQLRVGSPVAPEGFWDLRPMLKTWRELG